MIETNRGTAFFAIPLLYNAGTVLWIEVVSVSTGFCDKPDSVLIFLPIVSGVLEERLYLRYVEVFRFINKCGRDSGLGWSP